MYHGKYHDSPALLPPWRWPRQRRLLAAVLIAFLAALIAVRLLAAEIPGEKNHFRYEGRSSRIQEEFDGVSRSNVAITNTGDADAFFRAAVIITWRDGEGNLCRETPAEGVDYEIVFGSRWISAGGYYYWQGAVPPGESTGNLIESCTPLQEKHTEAGVYTLSVEVLADAVQCSPASAAAKAWGEQAAALVGGASG